MRIQPTVRGRWLVALVAVASLVLATAGPAQAAQTIVGAGSGFGGEYPPQIVQFDPCLPNFVSKYLPSDRIELDHVGTFAGLNSAGVTIALYTGPTRMAIDLQDHYISPIGTHDDEEAAATLGAACLVPTPVQGSAVVTGTNLGGFVNCASMAVEWTRAQSAVVGVLTGNCTIKGNTLGLTANVSANPTVIVVEGEQVPCTLAPTELPNPACDVMYAAAQFAGFNNIRTDPGSMMQTTYEAVGVQP